MPKQKQPKRTYCGHSKMTMKARKQEARDEIQEEIEELIQLKPKDEVLLESATLLQFQGFAGGFYKFHKFPPGTNDCVYKKRSKSFLKLVKEGAITKVQVDIHAIPMKLIHTGESFVQYEGDEVVAEDIRTTLEKWKFLDSSNDDGCFVFGQIKPPKNFSWFKFLELAMCKITASFEPVPPNENFKMFFYPDLEDNATHGEMICNYMEACQDEESSFELKFNAIWRYREK
jgi:hypothetical protein